MDCFTKIYINNFQMNKQLLFLLITILSINSYSQISFQKGYFINNYDQKVDCFIKNVDWLNNPTEIEYKLTESAEVQKGTIKTIKEFAIYNTSKYIRYSVMIDRSSNIITHLSKVREGVFKEEELFLKVLIEGKANLYFFKDSNISRFFYSKEDLKIEQLVYKKYLKYEDEISYNNRYKQQLLNNLKCPTFNMNKVENLDYKKSELIDFFIQYNKCNNQELVNFEEKQKKDLFNLNIRPGLNYSSLSIKNNGIGIAGIDFDTELGFRFGIEAEFILPFNKNKWAIIIEPTYQYFQSQENLTDENLADENLADDRINVDYTSIELPVGVRHYFFINEKSKIFINGSLLFDFSRDSNINFEVRPDLEIESRYNFAFGLGYKYNDRYSLELRYHTDRDLLWKNFTWSSKYNTFSLIFGYKIF